MLCKHSVWIGGDHTAGTAIRHVRPAAHGCAFAGTRITGKACSRCDESDRIAVQEGQMKAAYIQQTGPPEKIVYGDLPAPKPGPTQCLVKVGAVSVNPVDTYIRSGLVQMPLPFPFVIGCDLAGTVAEVVPQVTRFKPGDRVWGSNQGLLGRQGTFAEFCAAGEHWLYPTPANVSDEEAAAAALVGITAHLGLFQCAQLQQGETVFVNGGTGGVGMMVI